MKAGYLRISAEDQAGGLSPEIQRQALINAGAQQIFEDLGLSGYSGKTRPGFEALLSAITIGQVSQVICNTYSRLSRNAKDSARLDDALLAVEATVLDLGTGQTYEPRELTPELLALLARQESRAKSKRMNQTYQAFKDAGLSHSARAPFGIRIPTRASKQRGDDPPEAEERVPIRDPETYPLARQLVDHYLATGINASELVRWGQERGYPFTSGHGVHKWFAHPLVVRLVLNAGEPAQLEKIAARHRYGFKRSDQPNESHPLRGLVICSHCDKPMSSANRRSALRCTNRSCENNRQVRTELISWAISAALSKATETAPRKLLEATQGRQATPQEIELQSQQKALEKAVKSAPALEATLRPQIEALDRQLAELQSTDLSHWQTLAQEWIRGRDTWDWYQIPAELKPRIYRALIRSVHCDEGRPLRVTLADGTVGQPPDDWPDITNAGVTYGVEFLPDGRTRRAPLRDDGPDRLGWHRLLMRGDALEEFADRDHEKLRAIHDAYRRKYGYKSISDEERAKIIEEGPPEGYHSSDH